MRRALNLFPSRPPRSSLYDDVLSLTIGLRWLLFLGVVIWLYPFEGVDALALWVLGGIAVYSTLLTVLRPLDRHPMLALTLTLDLTAIILLVALLAPSMNLALPAFAALTLVLSLAYGWMGVVAAVVAFTAGETVPAFSAGSPELDLMNLALRADSLLVGGIVLGALVERHESMRARLARVALKERYLGVFDLQNFAKALEYLHKLAVRGKWHYSVMVLDVGGGKAKVTGKGGNDRDDTLFDLVGSEARSSLRSTDLIGRVGEAMFAIALPETSVAGAENVARRLRDRLKEFDSGLEVSVGTAELRPKPTDSSEDCLHSAFAAMRDSKSDGAGPQ